MLLDTRHMLIVITDVLLHLAKANVKSSCIHRLALNRNTHTYMYGFTNNSLCSRVLVRPYCATSASDIKLKKQRACSDRVCASWRTRVDTNLMATITGAAQEHTGIVLTVSLRPCLRNLLMNVQSEMAKVNQTVKIMMVTPQLIAMTR